MPSLRRLLFASLVLAASLAASACKQGAGDRCQIDDDCSGDLICTNLGFCGTNSQNTQDAAPLPDARPDAMDSIDAEPPDASGIDADIDAAAADASIDAG
jgi:hypothetical protein